jgi:hypothetical protein
MPNVQVDYSAKKAAAANSNTSVNVEKTKAQEKPTAQEKKAKAQKRISRATIEAFHAGCVLMVSADAYNSFAERIRLQEENDKLTGYDNSNEDDS